MQTKDRRGAASDIKELERKMLKDGSIRSGEALFAMNMQKNREARGPV